LRRFISEKHRKNLDALERLLRGIHELQMKLRIDIYEFKRKHSLGFESTQAVLSVGGAGEIPATQQVSLTVLTKFSLITFA
jgi:hypothetical protein